MRTKRPCRCSGGKAKQCLLLCESILHSGGRLWQLPGSGPSTASDIRLSFEKSNGILFASVSAYWRGEGRAELARNGRNLHQCPPCFLGGVDISSVPLIVQTITTAISTDISLPYLRESSIANKLKSYVQAVESDEGVISRPSSV